MHFPVRHHQNIRAMAFGIDWPSMASSVYLGQTANLGMTCFAFKREAYAHFFWKDQHHRSTQTKARHWIKVARHKFMVTYLGIISGFLAVLAQSNVENDEFNLCPRARSSKTD